MPQLETVLMMVEAADFPADSFDSVVGVCDDKSGGRLLFNLRVDSHANTASFSICEQGPNTDPGVGKSSSNPLAIT